MLRKIEQSIHLHSDRYCIFCILLVCIIFLFPYLFSNPTPLIYPTSELGTDLSRDVLPNIEIVVNTLKTTGQLPLWRDFLLSGSPLLGHPSIPLFYPVNWLLFILPLPLGLNLLILLDCAWMGIGMYWFLRNSENRTSFPSLFGAIAMALSPKWIAHLSGGHWFMLAALAWVPWALYAFDRYWHTKKINWLFLLATALAAQGMNHLPMFVITSLMVALFSLSYLSRQQWKSWLQKNAIGGGIVVVLTSGLMAAQILPFLELYPVSLHTTASSLFTSLNPAALLVSLFPPDIKYPEWFLFPGLTVLMFAGLSWAYGWTRHEKRWGLLGLIGLVLSLGENTPLYGWLFGWNPLMSVLRVPTRWWLLTILALAVLAASGFSLWMEKGQHLNRRAKMMIALLAGLEILAGIMRLVLGKTFPFDMLSTTIAAVLLAIFLALGHFRRNRFLPALFLLGLCLEFIAIGGTLIRPQSASDTGVTEEQINQIKAGLKSGERIFSPGEGFPASALVSSGIDAAEGYDALPLANYMKFIHLATGCPLVQEATGSAEELADCLNPQVMRPEWLKLLNVRYLVVRMDPGWNITQLSAGYGRAFSAMRVESTSLQSCFTDLQSIQPQKVALVEDSGYAGSYGSVTVNEHERGVNHEVFQVEVSDAPALLIRSESWAPGWHARVDGQLEQVVRVDCVLQGIRVQPGIHTVEFFYQPFGYPTGAWISVATLAGMWITSIVWTVLKKKQLSRQAGKVI